MRQYGLLLVLSIILIAGCTSTNYENKLFNDDLTKSKPSSPMDLNLNISTLPNAEMEIDVIITTVMNASNVTMNIFLPEQLKLIDGKAGFSGVDIIEGQMIERTIKVIAIKDGEGVIEANAITSPMGVSETSTGYWFGDNEKAYIFVTGNKVRMKDSPFTEYGSESSSQQIENTTTNPH